MRNPNAWHHAIVSHLHATGGPLSVDQIWQCMAAESARIAELVQLKKVKRVGPATYQLVHESIEATS